MTDTKLDLDRLYKAAQRHKPPIKLAPDVLLALIARLRAAEAVCESADLISEMLPHYDFDDGGLYLYRRLELVKELKAWQAARGRG